MVTVKGEVDRVSEADPFLISEKVTKAAESISHLQEVSGSSQTCSVAQQTNCFVGTHSLRGIAILDCPLETFN